MKKLWLILLFLFLFVFCLLFAFTGANSIWGNFSSSALSQKPGEAVNISNIQHNFLVIRVDDLQTANTQLLSVWIFFTTFSDPPYMVMKILYPNTRQDKILSTFSLDDNRQPSPQFLQEVKKLDFAWDGYIVVDDQGIQNLNYWMLGQPLDMPPRDSQSTPDGFTIYVNDSRQWSALCQSLGSIKQREDVLFWRDTLPAHLRTDLDFETMILFWDYMTNSNTPPYCETIPWG
ncbi:MAG: hypothetical protein IT308_01950 [Anaerolineaceae bacterium]|nr:hypothetical protein [Anaerolineaceae bacterium]